MKLSKQDETEARKAYEVYFDSYIKGDIGSIKSMLVNNYNQIGSAESEVFFNKQEALKFLHETIEQVAGKTKILNRSILVDPLKDYVLVTDLFDIYVLIEEDWVFYSKFRASTLMEKIKDHWKFVHQHSSVPDLKAQEGENIAIEKVSKENLELRNAIKRRTVELESKNRELEIEAALERVRTITMAMHNSDDVGDTVVTLFDEVLKLGLDKSIRCGIGILNKETDHMETWSATSYQDGEVDLKMGLLDMRIHPMLIGLKKAWDSGKSDYQYDYIGDDVLKYYKALNNEPEYPFQIDLNSLPENEYHRSFFYSEGILFAFAPNPISEAAAKVLNRFAGVFGQTYRRYLDLKKAEAQAREAQIEAALERVRSRTMAMQKSEEKADILGHIFKELSLLDIALNRILIWIFNNKERYITWWSANKEVESLPESYRVDYNQHPVFNIYLEAWQKKTPLLLHTLSGAEKDSWEDHLFNHTELSKIPKKVQKGMRGEGTIFTTSAIDDYGLMMAGSLESLSIENTDILQRFSQVFQQSYTRYLDVQKAEVQAREAQIEAALERVRSRTMGMQRSEELTDVASVLFQQVKGLGVPQWACGFSIWEIGDKEFTWYAGSPDGGIMSPCKIPLTEHPVFMSFDESRKRGDELFIYEKEGEKQESHYQYMSTLPGGLGDQLQNMVKSGFTFPTFQIDHLANFSHGNLVFITYEHFPEMHDVFKRFAKVFEQTYTRFLDLQKAESQAREAQIEVALERVRSRTMAMHQSNELPEVALVLWKQLELLKLEGLDGCAIHVYNDKEGTFDAWTAFPDLIDGERKMKLDRTKHDQHCIWVYEEWDRYYRAGEISFSVICNKKQLNEFIDWFAPNLPLLAEEMRSLNLDKLYVNGISFSNGILGAPSIKPLSDETWSAFKRLSAVFDLAFRRFEDLQKAETQAREAQIEAALERVRSRTMGMQHSRELIEAANLLFRQVRDMGVNLWSAGYGTWQKDKKATTLWMSSEDIIQKPFTYPHTEDPVSIRFSEAAQIGESLYVEEMGGEALKSHYEYMRKLPMVGEMLEDILKAGFDVPTFQVFHVAYFSYGYLLFITYEPCHEAHSIFKRFAKVFEQTYTRFLDLQKAEAQTKEAVKQSSLDRIRAEIASMRTTNDLNRITPLIWRELTTLDVPFFRCGVFIVDDNTKKLNVYLSNPSGDHLAAWNTEYESIPLFKATVDHWEKQIVYRDEWNQKQFIQFTKSLIDHGLIDNQDNFQAGMDAPDFLALQMVPFEQGMLYVGSSQKLDNEQVELVQSLADSFSVAYARYEDFKKLEEAKGRVENTLSDLKSAQNQLIQSEKMASLGELTAGIAHEIQNPLNFVNNFSEVNEELAGELNEEIDKGNMSEAKDIAMNIIENEQKISHHGKRAEAIVKGMLQHSRTNTGTKELTDINVLADEYLRLAYHGLRAKDKTFNAEFNLDIDENIPKIKVLPQEIGRVLLNLINNAFYAVNKKSKEKITGYDPEVIVATKKIDNQIEICVKDNGPGIPEEIKEKIFQPFFTTKPTGEGTGLGLSLSYDIVKSHGGEIKLETKENKGTEFKISLPF